MIHDRSSPQIGFLSSHHQVSMGTKFVVGHYVANLNGPVSITGKSRQIMDPYQSFTDYQSV
ncbi:hypothetical protein [uncultured Megasphaera sp.]|uniref:hypothetical protein n=1 Tax=uncultured Megasphaera sp. TaxID=165188 RepID=UPI0027DB99EB|nr:hypothetical protein [uncultured Megasphaera sp.]